MFTFLTVLYVLVCLFLVLVVLLQSGKGGGMGSALGGGTSQQVFGGAGAGNILTRVTAFCAFLFMALAISLEFLSAGGERALERAIESARERGAAATSDGATLEGESAEPASAPNEAPVSLPIGEAEDSAAGDEAADEVPGEAMIGDSLESPEAMEDVEE